VPAGSGVVYWHVENPTRHCVDADFISTIFSPKSADTPYWVRKEESAMAKLHARPSNQYRYEHYDPWGGVEII